MDESITYRLVFAAIVMMTSWVNGGELELRVIDADSGKPIGARVKLTDGRGRHPRIRKSAAFADHFTVAGAAVLPLSGTYQFAIHSGPEYLEQVGALVISRDATDNQTVKLKRFVDMSSHGWWSGDPWVERSRVDSRLLVVGEDLHLLGMPIATDRKSPTTRPPIEDRAVDSRGVALVESGGRVHLWNASSMAPQPALSEDASYNSGLAINAITSSDATHIEIATPAGWDLPMWVATDNIDSILLHQPKLPATQGTLNRRPRDKIRYPGASGVGRYHEDIYHHLLNTGLRIAPSASSLSGITKQPPGTFRTYVHLDGPFSADAWWDGLRKGRVMITNGPLIIPRINGELPGHVFRAAEEETVSLDVKLTLHTREKVDYLEFIKDGVSVREVRLDDWAKANGKLDPLEFDESGWLIVRAVTNHGDTYRYASTAPYYIEIGNKPRISRESAQFFLDWLIERAKILKSTNDAQRDLILPHLRAARKFWQQRLDTANAP